MSELNGNWLAVRTAYIVKQWSAKKCSDEFGLDVWTIKKRAAKEGWTDERNRMLANAEALVGDELREDAAAQAAALAKANAAALAAAIGDKRKTDAEFALWLAKIIQDSEADLKKIKDAGDRILARNRIAAMTARYLSARRLVLGIVTGQPSDTSNEMGGSSAPIAPIPTADEGAPAGGARRFVVKIHVPQQQEIPPALESVG